ncbi:MAG: DUF1285 domain-containing protein [Rhodospirillales bacterium]
MSKNPGQPISLSLSAKSSGKALPPKGITPRPGQVVCGELDMRIGRDGVWHYNGSPIGRKELVRLFSTVLRRDDAGDYWLITPAEMGRIEVEDAPFLAVELTRSGDGEAQVLTMRTNVDAMVTVDKDHPIRVDIDEDTGAPSPYLIMDGGIEARITRAVYYELVAMGNTGEKENFGVMSSGTFFSLGKLDNA